MSRRSTVQYAAVSDPSTLPLPTRRSPSVTGSTLGPTAEIAECSAAPSPGTTRLPDTVPTPTNAGRWVRAARRYPIQTTFSVIVCFVLLIIVITVLTLNMGVQQLYDQLPYNVTGVRVACFPGSLSGVLPCSMWAEWFLIHAGRHHGA